MGHIFDTNLNISAMSDENFNNLKRKLIYYKLKYAGIGKNPVLDKDTLTITCPFCKTRRIYKNVKFNNKFSYDFLFLCKNCKMRFYAIGALKKFAYLLYPITKPLYNSYIKIKRFIKVK